MGSGTSEKAWNCAERIAVLWPLTRWGMWGRTVAPGTWPRAVREAHSGPMEGRAALEPFDGVEVYSA